ncbi:hypothetical protein [Edaphobacter flagellatus]|uniref:hypothetical protein n=1 Tax=Edaphobacter flagellatus TaxID=1933044 RepID=UPI0021B1EC5B|nr:hypothetical protein [Edaphobacter flagellatus]
MSRLRTSSVAGVLAALILVAQGATPERVAGRYVLEGEHEVGSELVLQRGGQFAYMLSYGAADYTARGKWHVAGETVVLDTRPPTEPPFKLVRSLPLHTPDIRVWVTTKKGTPVPRLEVVLTTEKGDASATTDRDGMAIFPAASAAKSVIIRMPVYNKDSGAIALKELDTDITFVMNPEAIATVPFHGEMLKIEGDTLEMLYWDKTKPMVYRRQK